VSERAYAPRSGGRTAERNGIDRRTAASSAGGSSAARGARRYPAEAATQGTAALKLNPARVDEAVGTPRLRVAPPAPISVPRAPFVAVVIALVVAGVLGVLVINTKTNENSFRISKLQDQKAALDNQQQQLENQIAGYESTGNLDAAARRLGLVKADTPAYIRLPDGKIIGVPKPGTGQPAVTSQDAASTKNTQNNATQNGTTQNGTQNGTTQNGTTQNGVTQNGTTQNGTTQNGTTQNGTTQNGVSQNGTIQNGTTQNGVTQNGTVPGNATVPNGAVAGAGQ
jgi:hypothetical protein